VGSVFQITEPVDNLGGVLSALLVAALILAINFAPVPNKGALVLGLAVVAVAAGIAFLIRQRRVTNPLYDLNVAGRRVFWVAACAGIVVFGALMGAMFVGQQFLQNVLGYSTFHAVLAILPAAICMVLVAPRSAKLVDARALGSRCSPAICSVCSAFSPCCCYGRRTSPTGRWAWATRWSGSVSGLPARRRRTPSPGSVPVQRAGMASGTADLQRDLGGAIMQSIFGALLTAGYASAIGAAIAAAPNQQQINTTVQDQLTKSFAGAAATAEQYPQYASQITAAAKPSFLQGDRWAYTAGIVAILLGAALVFLLFPRRCRRSGCWRSTTRRTPPRWRRPAMHDEG
jgi:DHA2 family multidrug resistance protein-like MFS transporter